MGAPGPGARGAGGATSGSSSQTPPPPHHHHPHRPPPPHHHTTTTFHLHHHCCVVWIFISACVWTHFPFWLLCPWLRACLAFLHTPCSLALSVSLSPFRNFPKSGPALPPFPPTLAPWRRPSALQQEEGDPGPPGPGVERWHRARGRHHRGAASSPPAALPGPGPKPRVGRGGDPSVHPGPGWTWAQGPPARPPGTASLRPRPPSQPRPSSSSSSFHPPRRRRLRLPPLPPPAVALLVRGVGPGPRQ